MLNKILYRGKESISIQSVDLLTNYNLPNVIFFAFNIDVLILTVY